MKKKVTIAVCDVCETEERLVTVRVSGDLGRATLDLCPEHVKDLGALVKRAQKA